MEAFSDGVIAIIITIMALELHVPHGADPAALRASFVMLGIYWNNHHHFMPITERVDGRVLWAKLHLLKTARMRDSTRA
jgi:uncharacterized membrane protein